MSSLVIVTPPDLPLTASDVRASSRIDHQEDDALLADYIAAAAEVVASHTGRAVGLTTYRLTLDWFPSWNCVDILLPRPPAVGLDELLYLDSDGQQQSLDVESGLQVDLDGEPARLRPLRGEQWPSTSYDALGAVRITYTAGSEHVSPRLLQAMRLLVGTWYENRESVTEAPRSELPDGVARLLSGVRFRSRRLNDFLASH